MGDSRVSEEYSAYMNFLRELDKYSGNIALVTEAGKKISYAELLCAANDISKFINERCLIFILGKNCVETIIGYVGIMQMGAIPLFISSIVHNDYVVELMTKYCPTYIFSPTENTEIVNNFRTVYVCGSYSLVKTNNRTDVSFHKNLALLLPTSGSTGSVKYVRQSYLNLYSNASEIGKYLEITASDRAITTMPISYSYGLSIINSHLIRGASIILTEATVMEKTFWTILADNSATSFGGVPYIYEMLVKLRFEKMTLSSL
jgi:acyl-coenzyme A synthetase/AMP-(fatty) acid ligase